MIHSKEQDYKQIITARQAAAREDELSFSLLTLRLKLLLLRMSRKGLFSAHCLGSDVFGIWTLGRV